MKSEYEKKIQDLYAEVGRLTTELPWLKIRVVSELSRDERLGLVDGAIQNYLSKSKPSS